MDLKGNQLEAFSEALLHAFRNYESLERMVRFKLDLRLRDVVPPGPLNEVAFNLITWFEAGRDVEDLLVAAIKQVPGNPKLRQLALELIHTSDAPPRKGGEFEATVLPHVATLDVAVMRRRMELSEKCVCRMEVPEQSETGGTGFLVGSDKILTNWHVADLFRALQVGPDRGAVRFGFLADAQGVGRREGNAVKLAGDWLAAHSPVEELDYALIRLAEAPGMEPLRPAAHEFHVGDIHLILHHPEAAAMKVSAGAILGVNDNRITYSVNTRKGSSGSPVFTFDWNPVAIHHYGKDTGNRGIPLQLIWSDLDRQGKLTEL